MCIRDRFLAVHTKGAEPGDKRRDPDALLDPEFLGPRNLETCLLYTSDAADERSSVDLGGRRIIKKKKRARQVRTETDNAKLTNNHQHE